MVYVFIFTNILFYSFPHGLLMAFPKKRIICSTECGWKACFILPLKLSQKKKNSAIDHMSQLKCMSLSPQNNLSAKSLLLPLWELVDLLLQDYKRASTSLISAVWKNLLTLCIWLLMTVRGRKPKSHWKLATANVTDCLSPRKMGGGLQCFLVVGQIFWGRCWKFL